jgi:hypothetical protein
MPGLKILAIRPRPNCHRNFLKNLNAGEIYPLYSQTRFFNVRKLYASVNDEVVAVATNISGPEDLYNIKTHDGFPIEVSVSAIAGKNGAGKSTLVELLFASIYVASTVRKVMKPNMDSLNSGESSAIKLIDQFSKILEKQKNDLAAIDGEFDLAVAGKKKMRFRDLVFSLDTTREVVDATEKAITAMDEKLEQIKNERDEINRVCVQLCAELYYELDNVIYKLIIDKQVNDDGVELSIIPRFDIIKGEAAVYLPEKLIFDRKCFSNSFFYTIAVNYSHYALNSNHIGDWISLLFHKNDGYTSPAVINPMRTDGKFDINIELSLAKYRLLSNLLIRQLQPSDNEKIYLTDHQYVKSINFTLNKEKVKNPKLSIDSFGIEGEDKDIQFLKDILKTFLNNEKLFKKAIETNYPLKELLLNYILHKADDISKYDGFPGYKLQKKASENLNKLLMDRLRTESSHVAYKLNQAINFLKYLLTAENGHEFDISEEELKSEATIVRRLTLKELIEWMAHPLPEQMIEFIPPSIFNIEIELSGASDDPIFFHELSSGEQQMIHTIQSVLYHINNIVSAQRSDYERVTYRNINLVFDEIELYFHPEFQREFLDRMLTSLKDLYLDDDHNIKTINMIFLTHSPFILSDVPGDRVMRLKVDPDLRISKPTSPKNETFASNINELLADSFFLKGTLMGRYAERKINNLLDEIKIRGDISIEGESLLKLIGDSYLRSGIDHYIKNQYDKDQN